MRTMRSTISQPIFPMILRRPGPVLPNSFGIRLPSNHFFKVLVLALVLQIVEKRSLVIAIRLRFDLPKDTTSASRPSIRGRPSPLQTVYYNNLRDGRKTCLGSHGSRFLDCPIYMLWSFWSSFEYGFMEDTRGKLLNCDWFVCTILTARQAGQ